MRRPGGHGSEHVREEVAKWPSWLSDRVATVSEYITGRDSLSKLVGHLPKPLTMVSGNVLLDYPSVLDGVEGKLTARPNTPVVVGSTILRTSTHYAIKTDGSQVIGLERRASTPAEREVVDVFGITDSVLGYADQKALAPATAIARHVEELQPEHVEYTGNWAHFETPVDFENYLGGEYGNFDYR